MKKRMILIILALLSICAIGVNAEHVHDWSDWDYYESDSDYHYAIRYCYDCNQEEKQVLPHNLLSVPSSYSWGSNSICYAEFKCKDCYEYIKKPTTHKWKNLGSCEYYYLSKTQHEKSQYSECSQCESSTHIENVEGHALGYYKSGKYIYYGCQKCSYVVGDKYIPAKKTIKTTTKKGKTGKTTIPLLAKDKIKSIKKITGKNLITVEKNSKNKLIIKAKKKGKAKFKVALKSGAIYTYIVKIK